MTDATRFITLDLLQAASPHLSAAALEPWVDPIRKACQRYEINTIRRITAPAGEAQCDDDADGVTEPCLSQRQADELLNAAIDAVCLANDRLAWLSDYFLKTKLPPSCAPAAR